MTANKQTVERVRQKFMSHYNANPELYHENDIKNISENDWPIERFVLVNSNEEKAVQAVIKAMQWRKSFGIHNFNDQYFPYEIYRINFLKLCKSSKDGRLMIWANGKNYYKCSELDNIWTQFFAYQFECIDRQTSHQGWDYVVDATGIGLSNINTDVSNTVTEMFQNYWPRAIKYMITIDLPLLLNAFSKIWLAFMNEEIKSTAKFINKEELGKYLTKEQIPIHLGGTKPNLRNEIPSGVKKLNQLPHFGLTNKQIEKVYSTFKCLRD